MSEITENLSEDQLQNFDIDSIKEMIKAFEKKKKSFYFDLDDREKLSKDEIQIKDIIKKMDSNEKIISGLNQLLNAVEKETTFFSSFTKNVSNFTEDITDSLKETKKGSIKAIAEKLLEKGNIPDNETMIYVLDKMQYIVTGDEDKEIAILINKLEKSEEGNPMLQLEASNIIGKFTGLTGFSVFNTTQKLMIDKIFKGKEGFNDKYLHGYDSEKGNYIIDIADFVMSLQNTPAKKINSMTLANFFKYLKNDGATLDIPTLGAIFGEGTLFELGQLWENGSNNQIAKQSLIENGGQNIIDMIKIFSSPKYFLENIGKLNQEELKVAMQLLEQNIQSIKDKFREELNKELKEHNPNIPDKQIKQSIDELLNHLSEIYENEDISFDEKLKHIYLQFGKLNEEYNNCINIQKYTNDLNELKEKEKVKEIIQNKRAQSQTNNTEELSILKEKEKLLKVQAKKLQTITTINNLTDNNTISKIINGEINYDEYITNLRIQNEDLNEQFKEIEEIKLEEKIQNKLTEIKTIETQKKSNENYYIKNIPDYKTENNTLIINGKEITGITGNEYNSIIETNSKGENIIKNPEALKNLIDFKEKMKVLNLDFVWKYRNELTTEAKKHPEYSSINNTDTDLLNPKELHKLLNFVLTLIGEKGDTTSISGTYAKIIQINGGGMLNNKTNFDTKFGNIGQKFYELGYIGKNSFDTENQSNIMNYQNIIEQQKN